MLTMISVPQIDLLEDIKKTYESDFEVQILFHKWEWNELNSKYTIRDGLLYYK